MRFITICLFVVACFPVSGQNLYLDTIANPKWEVQVYFDLAIPIGEFGENLSTNGYGVGGEGLYHVQDPVWVGIGVHSFRFDNDRITYEDQFDDDIVELRELTETELHGFFHGSRKCHPIFKHAKNL